MSTVPRLQAIEKILKGEWEGAINPSGEVLTTYGRYSYRWNTNPNPELQDSNIIYLESWNSLSFTSELRIIVNYLEEYWSEFNFVTGTKDEVEDIIASEPFLFAISQVVNKKWEAARDVESRNILVRYDTYCKVMGVNPFAGITPSQAIILGHKEDLSPEYRLLAAEHTLSTMWAKYELQNEYNLEPRECIAALLKDADLEFEYEVNHVRYRIDYDNFMTHGIDPSILKVKWKRIS